MADLILRNIRKTYPSTLGPLAILNGITLTVQAGEIVVLLGPSGCGKTTLLNIVAGLVQPDEGDMDLTINGENITGPGPDRNIVFQAYTSYPWLTVLENVRFSLRFRNIPENEQYRRAEEYVRAVGLWEYRHEYPRVLSGGQQQRVAIARTLVGDPQVILMDEPFAALDALTREAMQTELLQLHRKTHCTILFVTHDIAEAAFLGSRVLILSRVPTRVTEEVNTKSERELIGDLADCRGIKERDLGDRGFERGEEFRYAPRFLEIQKKLKEKVLKQADAVLNTHAD
jgi:ABC-type nitrate/sulfonate/bicarbonate transport system ATPase subunit